MMRNAIHQETSPEAPAEEWLQRTELFRRWADMKQEILLHKWYESERAGYDVGWERAATNWMIHHGGRRRHDPSRPS